MHQQQIHQHPDSSEGPIIFLHLPVASHGCLQSDGQNEKNVCGYITLAVSGPQGKEFLVSAAAALMLLQTRRRAWFGGMEMVRCLT